jgi:hypothetical protein
MRVGRKSGTRPIGLGFRALKGGGVVVGVVVDEGDPRVVLSTFLPTAAAGDRLALEPYRVAYEMKHGPDGGASTEAAAAVAEGHKRQGELAAQGMCDIVRKLRDAGCQPVIAALLVKAAPPCRASRSSATRSLHCRPTPFCRVLLGSWHCSATSCRAAGTAHVYEQLGRLVLVDHPARPAGRRRASSLRTVDKL